MTMTPVREVSMSESLELYIDGSARGEDVSADESEQERVFGLYRQYGEEGHLVALIYLEEEGPGYMWYAWCINCKENTVDLSVEEMKAFARFGGGDSAKPGPKTINFGQAKWWAFDHRAENGLPKQEFCPAWSIDQVIEMAEAIS